MSSMGRLDNEENIIKYMHSTRTADIAFLTKNNFEKRVYNSVFKKWSRWTPNNAHDAEPPDYFSDGERLMFDVMRINDSETIVKTKRGKEVMNNPVLKRESEIFKELHELFPNVKEENIFINAMPEGDYDKFHNYQNYYRHAQRVFLSHIAKIPRCRELHQGLKMGFLIMDETESYVQHLNLMDAITPLDKQRLYVFSLSGIHAPFIDRRFMDCLIKADLDFAIWYCPNKHAESFPIQLPKICFIDLRSKTTEKLLRDYSQYLMRRM